MPAHFGEDVTQRGVRGIAVCRCKVSATISDDGQPATVWHVQPLVHVGCPRVTPLDQNGAWSFPRHINVNTGAAFPRGFEYSRPALEWRAFSAFAGTAIKDRLVT
jgi:hypothetical protein